MVCGLNLVYFQLLHWFVDLNLLYLQLLRWFVVLNLLHLKLLRWFVVLNIVNLQLLRWFAVLNLLHLQLLRWFTSVWMQLLHSFFVIFQMSVAVIYSTWIFLSVFREAYVCRYNEDLTLKPSMALCYDVRGGVSVRPFIALSSF